METTANGTSAQDVINGFFQSVGMLDAQAAALFFAEELDFYIAASPFMPWTGRRSKREEVGEALQVLFDAHVDGEEHFDLDHVFFDGTEAAVFGIAGRLVKASGKRFSAHFCMRMTVNNGLITKFLMLEDSREIEKAINTDKG